MRDDGSKHPDPGRSLASLLGTNDSFSGFSRLSIALVLSDPRQDDNPIVYVNDAFTRVTGYAREAVLGRNCRFLQGEATDKRDVDRIREAVARAREVSVDILNYTADGAPFRNRLMISPVMDSAGRPRYFLGLLKRLGDSDRSADNQISDTHLQQIKALVRRDLSLILASLRDSDSSDADGLDRQIAALPRRLETLQFVYEELRHSRRVRDSALVDIGSVIGRVGSALAHAEGRPGVRVVQSVEGCDVTLEAATRIALILAEVLHNALAHAFVGLDEGRLELRVSRLSGGGLRILVADDGVGLPRGLDWPDPRSAGGRLVRDLLAGLDASLNVTRGAAGTVVLIDVPVDLSQ